MASAAARQRAESRHKRLKSYLPQTARNRARVTARKARLRLFPWTEGCEIEEISQKVEGIRVPRKMAEERKEKRMRN